MYSRKMYVFLTFKNFLIKSECLDENINEETKLVANDWFWVYTEFLTNHNNKKSCLFQRKSDFMKNSWKFRIRFLLILSRSNFIKFLLNHNQLKRILRYLWMTLWYKLFPHFLIQSQDRIFVSLHFCSTIYKVLFF